MSTTTSNPLDEVEPNTSTISEIAWPPPCAIVPSHGRGRMSVRLLLRATDLGTFFALIIWHDVIAQDQATQLFEYAPQHW